MATLVTSIHQFVRIPGQKPMRFSESLDLPGAEVVEDGGKWWASWYAHTPQQQYVAPITENVYEQALYAFATARFAKFIERK